MSKPPIWEVTIFNRDPATMSEVAAVTASATGAFERARAMLKDKFEIGGWECAVNGEKVTYDKFIQRASNLCQVADFVAIAPNNAARIESHYAHADG